MKKIILLTLLFLLPQAVLAQENQDYFNSLAQLQAVPDGYAEIKPITDPNELKKFISLYKKSDLQDFEDLSIDQEGKLSSSSGDSILALYKGDFSNENIEEYALITIGGTMRINNVYLYKSINSKLVNAELLNILDNAFNLDEGNNFYLWTAQPFAITKDGKTYLRFMNYPGQSRNYDKTKLQLCTYYLHKEKVDLSGPNLDFSGPKNTLASSKKCIH